MPDVVVRVYLLLLIILHTVFPVFWALAWFFQTRRPRHPLIKAKLLLRDGLFLISGLVGWYLFSTCVLSNWLIMFATLFMLILGTYATEIIIRLYSKHSSKSDAR